MLLDSYLFMKYFINNIIPYLVVLAQGLFLIALISRKRFTDELKKYGMHIIFVTSILALLGSLFYSKIMGYDPCELCWYQRILMYPLVLISGFSLKKSSLQIKKMILSLAIVGVAIGIYQYITQITDTETFCGIGATSCSDKIVFAFGYISIPLMAVTAFLIIIFAAYHLTYGKKKKK